MSPMLSMFPTSRSNALSWFPHTTSALRHLTASPGKWRAASRPLIPIGEVVAAKVHLRMER